MRPPTLSHHKRNELPLHRLAPRALDRDRAPGLVRRRRGWRRQRRPRRAHGGARGQRRRDDALADLGVGLDRRAADARHGRRAPHRRGVAVRRRPPPAPPPSVASQRGRRPRVGGAPPTHHPRRRPRRVATRGRIEGGSRDGASRRRSPLNNEPTHCCTHSAASRSERRRAPHRLPPFARLIDWSIRWRDSRDDRPTVARRRHRRSLAALSRRRR